MLLNHILCYFRFAFDVYLIIIECRYSGADISVLVRDALFEPVRKCRLATHFKRVQAVTTSATSPSYFWTPSSPGTAFAWILVWLSALFTCRWSRPHKRRTLFNDYSWISTTPSWFDDGTHTHSICIILCLFFLVCKSIQWDFEMVLSQSKPSTSPEV